VVFAFISFPDSHDSTAPYERNPLSHYHRYYYYYYSNYNYYYNNYYYHYHYHSAHHIWLVRVGVDIRCGAESPLVEEYNEGAS